MLHCYNDHVGLCQIDDLMLQWEFVFIEIQWSCCIISQLPCYSMLQLECYIEHFTLCSNAVIYYYIYNVTFCYNVDVMLQ